MANSVDPDEKAPYEPSHLNIHCLQRYLIWSTEMTRKDWAKGCVQKCKVLGNILSWIPAPVGFALDPCV